MKAQAVTHRRVVRIAVPIVLANATVPILGLVDTGVVGQLGLAAPIGAVGIGAIILTAVYWIFGFLRMGTTGLTSQAFGAGDRDEVNALLMRALLMAAAGGLLVIVLQVPILWLAFSVSPASSEVEEMARTYVSIRVWSAPAAIAGYGLTGWLIALERTRTVFALQLWMNGLNILLDLWFVLGLGWGVEGVALATFLAEWSGLVLGLVLCQSGLAGRAWRNWGRVFDLVKLRRMLTVNGDILIRSVLLQIGFMSFLFLGAGFGDTTLAANQVLLQFLHVTAYAVDGLAFAAETLVGQALGAKARPAFRRAVWLTALWGGVVALAMSIGFAVLGGWMIDVIALAPDVRVEARHFLPWMIAAPVAGIASWMLDGIFIGATRTRDMRIAMIWSLLVYIGAIFLLMPLWQNHGLWAALLVFFVARAVTLARRFPALLASVSAD